MMDAFSFFFFYLIVVNIAAFFLMYTDKRKAVKHKWRAPEKMLFLSAAIGGSVGAILGMWIFHHKTKHWYFVVGMPVILIVQVAAGWLFCMAKL